MDPRYQALVATSNLESLTIWSIPGKQFLSALAKGNPIYRKSDLIRYVADDLAIIEQTEPDLIVGDFRLSLSISARLTGTPYATVANAYWSPYSRHAYPVPELPLTRVVGQSIAQWLFDRIRPLAFSSHCKPLNQARRHYGLASLGKDLRRIYTDADEVLLADAPEYFPVSDQAVDHLYLGPIYWAPETPLPSWWDEIDTTRPVVFVTMGSSGQAAVFNEILNALANLPVTVIGATGGRVEETTYPPNARVDAFIPIDRALEVADLVVCNGGSLMTYQSIAAATPVLGIPSNLDQHLNMAYLTKAGVTQSLRSEQVSPTNVSRLILSMLGNTELQDRVKRAATILNAHDYRETFREFVRTKLKTSLTVEAAATK